VISPRSSSWSRCRDKPYPYESKLLVELETKGRAQGLIALIVAKGLQPIADHFLQIETCEDDE
jgi:hypothetical protein